MFFDIVMQLASAEDSGEQEEEEEEIEANMA